MEFDTVYDLLYMARMASAAFIRTSDPRFISHAYNCLLFYYDLMPKLIITVRL